MTDNVPILLEMAAVNRRIDRSGMVTRNERPVPSAQRPMFRREVIAPGVVIGGGFFVALFTLVGGLLVSADYLTDSYSVGWFGLFLYCTAAGSAVFTYVAWIQLPHYRKMQTVTKDAVIPAKEPAQDSGRRSELERVGRGVDVKRRCKWRPGWKAILARKLHDDEGNWIGADKPPRELFDHPLLVTALTKQFHEDTRNVQKDLRDLDWLDDSDRWTVQARRELRAELFIPNGGFET